MENKRVELMYVTTPFCGVCKSAKPVVEILAASLELPLSEMNANEHKIEMQHWKVTRVPALIVRKDDVILQVFDHIGNLSEMYAQITTVLEKNS